MRLANQQGQTIIEVLIAIVVMFVGMLGVLALAQANINNEKLGVDRLTATQLAREATEVIRATRDSNYMQTTTVPAPSTLNAWDQGICIELTKNAPSCWTLDVAVTSNTDVLSFTASCSNDVLSPEYQLKRDDVSGIYTLTSGTPTKFFRKIATRPICLEGGNEIVKDQCQNLTDRIGIEVRSEVGWLHFDQKKTVVLTEHLYNWR